MALPLKAKLGIRDVWENADGPVQQAFKTLQDTLGLGVRCNPDWPLIVTELRSIYDDKKDLVTSVSTLVQVWCRAMNELLENEDNADWADQVIEKIRESGSNLCLFIDVDREASPKTTWDPQRSGFLLTVPRTEMRHIFEHLPLLSDQLRSAFDSDKKPAAEANADDWSEVQGDTVVVSHRSAGDNAGSAATERAEVGYLADVSTLPRPEQLLLKPPYYLIVTGGGGSVEVQCSHSPSLELIAAYLKKWCRADHNQTTKPPVITIELHQAAFGLGVMYDRLSFATESRRYNGYTPSAPIILSFVESVLGYRRVKSGGFVWEFRRDAALNKF